MGLKTQMVSLPGGLPAYTCRPDGTGPFPAVVVIQEAFGLNGNVIYFAAFAKHIGLYPGPAAILEFKKELAGYPTSKGAIQFPFDAPLPLPLIKKIARFRLAS